MPSPTSLSNITIPTSNLRLEVEVMESQSVEGSILFTKSGSVEPLSLIQALRCSQSIAPVVGVAKNRDASSSYSTSKSKGTMHTTAMDRILNKNMDHVAVSRLLTSTLALITNRNNPTTTTGRRMPMNMATRLTMQECQNRGFVETSMLTLSDRPPLMTP